MISKESKDVYVVTTEIWGEETCDCEEDAIKLVRTNGRLELSAILRQWLDCTDDGRTNEYRSMLAKSGHFAVAKVIHDIYERYHPYFKEEIDKANKK